MVVGFNDVLQKAERIATLFSNPNPEAILSGLMDMTRVAGIPHNPANWNYPNGQSIVFFRLEVLFRPPTSTTRISDLQYSIKLRKFSCSTKKSDLLFATKYLKDPER